MIAAKDAVVWANEKTKEVLVSARGRNPGADWGDPIGAAYSQWGEMRDSDRTMLMLETAIDLGLQGYDLKAVIRAFAEIAEFKKLGSESFPMCRALTFVLVGQRLEPNTMTFDELLENYGHP